MKVPTDNELLAMTYGDEGDSIIMRMPDGTQVATGFTAEGHVPDSVKLPWLRRMYESHHQEKSE